MIYLIQLLRLLDSTREVKSFYKIFSDISVMKELGYDNEEAIAILLESHFGLTMEDDDQLDMLTNLIVNKPNAFRAAIAVEKQRRL